MKAGCCHNPKRVLACCLVVSAGSISLFWQLGMNCNWDKNHNLSFATQKNEIAINTHGPLTIGEWSLGRKIIFWPCLLCQVDNGILWHLGKYWLASISTSDVLVSHTEMQESKGQERKVWGENEFKLYHRYWKRKIKGASVRGNILQSQNSL